MKQSFMMRFTSRRFYGKYRLDEVACVSVGAWDEIRPSLLERGFREKDGEILMRKDAALAGTLSCDYVLRDETEDVEAGILRQRERCRTLGDWHLDTRGRACYVVLLYKDRVTEEDIRALKKGQSDALAFQRMPGPQRFGGALLLVLADRTAEMGFYCKSSDAADPRYARACETLEELFGKIC